MAEHAGKGFIWYELMTTDVDAAKAFYGAVVGWQTHDSGMPGMRYELFGMNGKDVGGMMTMPAAAEHKAMWMAHIYTPDVDAAAAAVTDRGGSILRPPTDIPSVGRFAVVRDPQSAVYLLFQPSGNGMWQPLDAQAVGNIGWHELVTTDWQQAWDFYSGLYGWTKHMSVDMDPMGTYQTFMLTETQGGGMMNRPPAMQAAGAPPHWTYYITVDSIQAAKQRVLDSGGTVMHGPTEVPGGSWILQGVDPQCARFALTAKS